MHLTGARSDRAAFSSISGVHRSAYCSAERTRTQQQCSQWPHVLHGRV